MSLTKKSGETKPAGKAKKTEQANETKKENELIFADGIAVFSPHKNAPDFVKANISIGIEKLAEWLEKNGDKLTTHEKYGQQLKLSLKESKGGVLYLSVDTYGTKFAE